MPVELLCIVMCDSHLAVIQTLEPVAGQGTVQRPRDVEYREEVAAFVISSVV